MESIDLTTSEDEMSDSGIDSILLPTEVPSSPNRLQSIDLTVSEDEPNNSDYDSVILPTKVPSRLSLYSTPTNSNEPPSKRPKLSSPIEAKSVLSVPILQNSEFKEVFSKHWTDKTAMRSHGVELIIDPFRVCVIDGFVENPDFLNQMRQEMYEIDWNRRSLDLYDFFQSEDLKNATTEYLKAAYEFLRTSVMPWVAGLTGLELNKISATCSFYSLADYLLIHDDLQEDRAVAFVLYMTHPVQSGEYWTDDMGGMLELFSKDDKGHPVKPVRGVSPRNNQFVFFQVTNDSYHQVSEVLNMEHCRFSINGWFHTPKPVIYKQPEFETPSELGFDFTSSSENNLEAWVAPVYIDERLQHEIHDLVEENSEVSLEKFVIEEKYTELCTALEDKSINWQWKMPPNRYRYEVALIDSSPQMLQNFIGLCASSQFKTFLHKLTELDLSLSDLELQRWTLGCYSLIGDVANTDKVLDVVYFFCPQEKRLIGGRTLYVSTEEEIQEAYTTIEPTGNALNIVYGDLSRFVKHISRKSTNNCFYSVFLRFKENT